MFFWHWCKKIRENGFGQCYTSVDLRRSRGVDLGPSSDLTYAISCCENSLGQCKRPQVAIFGHYIMFDCQHRQKIDAFSTSGSTKTSESSFWSNTWWRRRLERICRFKYRRHVADIAGRRPPFLFPTAWHHVHKMNCWGRLRLRKLNNKDSNYCVWTWTIFFC